MKKEDGDRLKWLMDHYAEPWRQSHDGIIREREKNNGILPDSRPHEFYGEFEGVFFCRIICELMTGKQRKRISFSNDARQEDRR